ncbi:MAG: hypothetical protein WCH97_07875, partial [Actinomycetes bacterium]
AEEERENETASGMGLLQGRSSGTRSLESREPAVILAHRAEARIHPGGSLGICTVALSAM